MPRTTYDVATKSAIIHATLAARAEGKSWEEAHAAAKTAGYSGSLNALMAFIRGTNETSKTKKSEPAEAAPAADSSPAEKPAKRRRKGKTKAKTTKPAKPKGERLRYDAEAKATIIAATLEARKAGSKWAEAHQAAVAAGYKGGLPALKVLISKAGKTPKKRGRKGKAKVAVPAKKAAAAPSMSNVAGNLEELISREIKSRVDAAIQAAIAELQKLIK